MEEGARQGQVGVGPQDPAKGTGHGRDLDCVLQQATEGRLRSSYRRGALSEARSKTLVQEERFHRAPKSPGLDLGEPAIDRFPERPWFAGRRQQVVPIDRVRRQYPDRRDRELSSVPVTGNLADHLHHVPGDDARDARLIRQPKRGRGNGPCAISQGQNREWPVIALACFHSTDQQRILDAGALLERREIRKVGHRRLEDSDTGRYFGLACGRRYR